ncbi:sialate O-acetylesterase [Coraliomargarita sinensis]|nr:sialate O-acetylesterase [Coraliomargarita sinensis]
MKNTLLCLSLFFAAFSIPFAELSMPNFFGDHMVLQAGKPVKLWGTAEPEATVAVQFAGKTFSTESNVEGKWSLHLPAMLVDAEGQPLQVVSGKDRLNFQDVLLGEVWLASGQSNMEWPLERVDPEREAIMAADLPEVRFFQAQRTTAASPQSDVPGTWTVSHPETAAKYSAVAYFFARKLNAELGVPVGILQCAWGGKPVETFTSRDALITTPSGASQIMNHDKQVAAYDEAEARANYEKALAAHETAKKQWEATPKEERKSRAPRPPRMQRDPALIAGRPATIWNGMVHPFVGYAVRGAIWYQGESNRRQPNDYEELFSVMINDWRAQWGDDFRFLWAQLANFQQPVTEPGTNDGWAVIQDHQRRCLKLPKTGMAVINDIGDANDIHPKNKKDVGERLARWALADDYGQDVIQSGPLYKSHTIEGDEVIVSFDYPAEGLKVRDGSALKHFEIKDAEGTWHWADAEIDGSRVVISNRKVSQPTAARYAWAANPEGANLINSEGLPASLFTTE